MSNQKLARALKYRFRSVFLDFPDSYEELFCNLKHCISLFDPEWVQNLKPSSEENIQKLEQMVEQDFGKQLPEVYRLYLQEMGANDGALLLQYIADLNYFDDWNWEFCHFKTGDMAQSPEKCMEKIRRSYFATELTSSFLWYLFPDKVSDSKGFAFTLNPQNEDEIVLSHGSCVICYDTFPKQLAYCEYLKAIHWIEDHSEPMKRKKWKSFSASGSDSMFSARFRAYCPVEWWNEEIPFSAYTSFLETLEAQFYLEEAWFSRQKEFPDEDFDCSNDDHTFFSRYIAFSPMSDLTLLIEWHSGDFDLYYRPDDRPFIQVHLLGNDAAQLNEIIDAIRKDTTLAEIENDETRRFAKMELI